MASSFSLYTLTVQSGPPGSPSADAALSPHPRLQTFYSLSIHFLSSPSAPPPPPHTPGCFSTPPASSSYLTVPGFFNGMLAVSEPAALNCNIFFCLIPLTLFLSRNLTLIHLSLTRTLEFLLCFLIAPTPGLAFSLMMPRTLVVASPSSSGRAYPSPNFLFSLSSLDLYYDYVGVNISLNNSSSLSFLDVYALPIRSSPTDSRTDSFSPSILSSSRNLFILEDFSCHHLSGTQKVLPTPWKKVFIWVISSDLIPSMTLTYLLFSIALLAIAPSLTSALFPPFSPSLAPGRCFRTWALIIYQFY